MGSWEGAARSTGGCSLLSSAPWLAQYWAARVRERTFSSIEPKGFCEDDDNGKAAATSLLAMGLFDLRGGAAREPIYEITSPAFDRIAIRLDSRYYPGGEFVIETRHNSPQNMYIRDASLDGQPLGRPWLYHREIIRGGRLILELGNEPNRSWGSQPKQAPPSG